MSKMHDKFKRPNYVVPKSKSLGGSTVIQQLGLDTPQGLQRLVMMLLTKLDPKCDGIIFKLDDFNHVMYIQNVEKRNNFLVHGLNDQIFMKMCTDTEFVAIEEYYKKEVTEKQQ